MPCVCAFRHYPIAAYAAHATAVVITVLSLSLDVAAAPADEDEDSAGRDAKLTMADHVERIHRIIEQHRADAKEKGWRFVSLSEEQVDRQLSRTNSPMIVSESWNDPPGGPIRGSVALYNPDPVPRYNLYLHVFVGPANPVPDLGSALATVDSRFPRLTWPPHPMTTPAAFGLSLAPGAGATLPFRFATPANVEKGTYLANTLLFEGSYVGVGQEFDRSFFPFDVQ